MLIYAKILKSSDHLEILYRWVQLKPDFLGAGKSVLLRCNLAYPIIILSLIIQGNLVRKIWAKWESSLTAVQLKWDPPVCVSLNVHSIQPVNMFEIGQEL